mmetsp:Transcript_32977/g.46829  ORF Transcript_32977/g.46829 Transcript_32977/m.46829 type:complete len:288 (+) Transcript_32977:70-933(+)|eukprot:CAMPEP_0202466528 /NCGR_PEP_ID=MMETSP1360-20130828/69078_1 /ASSEMBLY_ACC=CAM_ASM_000848 /TAXON_ID=515479 /ORGANISM="Licmophora paradoxa, Strain CCMP2313" /LENGTH=287 /DNA_ID=CAMNT_0049090699 /DNA_START=48 /DNA_END=911 /DNA_ORIENTATION=+
MFKYSIVTIVAISLTPFASSVDTSFSHLRGGDSSGFLESLGPRSDYDDLLKCMWNGTTVGACYLLNCKWCESPSFSLCVTDEFSKGLNGTYFTCETPPAPGPAPVDDDDAAADDDDNDDDTDDTPANDDTPQDDTFNDDTPQDDKIVTDDDDAPTDDTTALDDDSPPTDDNTIVDDDAASDDDAAADDDEAADDDDAHDTNNKYMDDLLECMLKSKKTCSGNNETNVKEDSKLRNGGEYQDDPDLKCVWCVNAHQMGMCFSDEAAQNINGPFYNCEPSVQGSLVEQE